MVKSKNFKILKYYLDTSILNFILFTEDSIRSKITSDLIFELKNTSELYISEVVLREISAAKEPQKAKLIELIKKIEPTLVVINDEVISLAEHYIKEGIIPEKYRDDALHISASVINELDVILSWNFQHIVKLKTRREVNGINMILGYKSIEICSPEEVNND